MRSEKGYRTASRCAHDPIGELSWARPNAARTEKLTELALGDGHGDKLPCVRSVPRTVLGSIHPPRFRYLRRAIARLPDPSKAPGAFPGVEVTCDDAVQCLVLFDADTKTDVWHRLFGGHLLTIQAPDLGAPRNPLAKTCGKIIADFLQGISADSGLNGCSIMLPHKARSPAG